MLLLTDLFHKTVAFAAAMVMKWIELYTDIWTNCFY